MATSVLILPGYQGSGETHWQTHWEKNHPDFKRIEQNDWDHPVCDEWVKNVEIAVKNAGKDVIIVSHSIGCLVVAHWASMAHHSPIKGALIVAPPDPKEPTFPTIAEGFEHTPLQPFPFPSIIVASSNDPYASLTYSKQMADAWGSSLVNVGEKGHINTASNLGLWKEGLTFLEQLRRA
ncbi:alpha/beta hydrolase [Sulfurospirillum diekertiae]|uniref:Alpha/beta hydrolase n=1 Tax=Sulfurospirillum diekertiae TaxID=1854492 RepID=A0A290HCT7_9BACT|nr:alpha/beta hydrolase [Sulfurospirillum diekertiae]ATB69235.1 serine hydrolase family protein [Sulfurospirillum diekertiae]QIR76884.1 alpha/beta hydrolase [Sulfurospirillum diekertiae]QIR79501.1 alpha/beta hydrolase [Sulfurospirillum diekertiae]